MNAQLSLYDALVSINIPGDKARAVVTALEQEMTAVLATKSDLEQLRLAAKSDLDHLRQATKTDLEHLRQLLTQKIDSSRDTIIVKLGSMMVIGMGLLFAALKLT